MESTENRQKYALQDEEDLLVRILDLHLEIETSELSHVPRSVRVLGPENGANAENTLATSSNLELLVELGRLSKEGLLAEVSKTEDVAATLRCSTNEGRGLELLEATLLQI